MSASLTLSKKERICSKKLIDQLFTGSGSHSMAAYPLRVVYMDRSITEDDALVQMLVSVPKRYFKRAVNRNRIKRQVREAFRKHKHFLTDALVNHPERGLAIAFIWLSDELQVSAEIDRRVELLLQRVVEKL